MRIHAVIVRAGKGEFRARIMARNGRVLFWGETYKRRGGAIKAVRALGGGMTIFDTTRRGGGTFLVPR